MWISPKSSKGYLIPGTLIRFKHDPEIVVYLKQKDKASYNDVVSYNIHVVLSGNRIKESEWCLCEDCWVGRYEVWKEE